MVPENNRKPLILVIVVVLLVAGAYFLMRNYTKSSSIDKMGRIDESTIPTDEPVTGASYFVWDIKNMNAQVGQEFPVRVKANSFNDNVTGFDLVIDYDPTALQYVRQESALVGFELHEVQQSQPLAFTAVKDLATQDEKKFNYEPIMTLYFKPLKAGNAQVKILDELQRQKTQIINSDSEKKTQGSAEVVQVMVL